MGGFIYFMKEKSLSEFKIGKAKSLTRRLGQPEYKTEQTESFKRYKDKFVVAESFFLRAPENYQSEDLLRVERHFQDMYRKYRISSRKREYFRIEVFEECLDEAASIYQLYCKSEGDAWTLHPLADFLSMPRPPSSEHLIAKFIARGHKHLGPGGKKVTKRNGDLRTITIWVRSEFKRALKSLQSKEIAGLSYQQDHIAKALIDYLQAMEAKYKNQSTAEIQIDSGAEVSSRMCKRGRGLHAITAWVPAHVPGAYRRLAAEEVGGITTMQGHYDRALAPYLEDLKLSRSSRLK